MLRQAELTKRQKQILGFVRDTHRETGFVPSIQETAAHFGFKSSNSVRQHLRLIEQKGFVRRIPGRSRALVLTKPDDLREADFVRIPLLGRIAAGTPNIATEEAEAMLTLPKQLFSGKDLFALRIQGTSMINSGILDGDVVVISRSLEVRNGDIGAVLIGDEATLKRIYRKPQVLLLKASNPTFKDIHLTGLDAKQPKVLGKLIGVVRKF